MPTFMFADIAGFTAITEAHGDTDASELAQQFEALVRASLPAGARLVKMMGDAAMVVGDAPLPVVVMARELVTAVEGLPGRPAVRIGIQTGEAIERGGDFWGHTINVAARLASEAEPCQILTTRTVKEECEGASLPSDLYFESVGKRRLRNVSEPLDLFAISGNCAEFPTDPVCQMRLSDAEGAGSVQFAGRVFHFCSLQCIARFAADPDRYVSPGLA